MSLKQFFVKWKGNSQQAQSQSILILQILRNQTPQAKTPAGKSLHTIKSKKILHTTLNKNNFRSQKENTLFEFELKEMKYQRNKTWRPFLWLQPIVPNLNTTKLSGKLQRSQVRKLGRRRAIRRWRSQSSGSGSGSGSSYRKCHFWKEENARKLEDYAFEGVRRRLKK